MSISTTSITTVASPATYGGPILSTRPAACHGACESRRTLRSRAGGQGTGPRCTWVRVQPTYNGIHRGDYSITTCPGYSIVVDEDVSPPAPVTRYVYLEPLS